MLIDPSAVAIALMLGCDKYEAVSVSYHENAYVAGMDGALYLGDMTRVEFKCAYQIKTGWEAPTTKEDGRALSLDDIAGYRMFISSSTSGFDLIRINDPRQISYMAKILGKGRTCFSVYAVDTDGLYGKATSICVTLGDK